MKKGINMWSFDPEKSIRDCMLLAKKAGFEGIELALSEKGELSLESTNAQISAIKEQAAEIGIEITSLACGLYWTHSFTSLIPANRWKAMEIAKQQLAFAALLNVDTVLIVPGAVGVDFIPNSEIVDYETAYNLALEAFVQLAVIAEDCKVHIGLENVWNKFLLSPLEMRDFIDKINSHYVGAYLDVGNVVATGYPQHWIKILNRRIRKVHFKDYKRQAGGLHGFVDLLAGDVNYPVVMEQLHAIGYADYVIAEMIPAYAHFPDQIIYNTSQSMNRILGREDKQP